MKYILGMNGEYKVGKSWLCEHLKDMLKSDVDVRHTSLMSIPWRMFQDRFSAELGLNDLTYEEFKAKVYPDGVSGRLKFISFVDSARESNPVVWTEAWDEANDEDNVLYLIESLGFDIEQFYFRQLAAKFATLVIAGSHQTPGQKFSEDDSRFCLSATPNMRFVNSQSAFDALQRRIENARGSQDDSTKPLGLEQIWQAIHLG